MDAHNFKELTNKKFGRLIVIKVYSRVKGRVVYLCSCKCGTRVNVQSSHLTTGHTTSCGCYHLEKVIKHGDSRTRFYKIWHAMKSRCGKKENYTHLSFTKRWGEFTSFKEDMFKDYNNHCKKYGVKNTTIDRIDNKKGYSKLNCRWATYKKQNNNA